MPLLLFWNCFFHLIPFLVQFSSVWDSPLQSPLLFVVGCLLCAVEMESSPGVACSPKGALKAMERGGQESDRLKQCWGKSLPKDCFSSWFTDQSRRRMRRRGDSENTQVAAAGSLLKEYSKQLCGSLCGSHFSWVCGCSRTELLHSLLLTGPCSSSCGTETGVKSSWTAPSC